MTTRLYEALKTAWDAASLDDTFAGGVWFDRAPSHTAFPYVVMSAPAGNIADLWTSSGEIMRQSVQFAVFLKEDETNDPVSQLGTHLRTLKAAFDFVSLTLTGSMEYVIEMRPVREVVMNDPDDTRIWQGQVEYVVRRHTAASY